MTTALDILIIIVCIFALWGGAVWVVESASHIAKKIGLSELVIGLTVVAIATSAPEFAVTVYAALTDQSAISVGNVVGSNIFNLGIILGLVALYSSLKTTRALLYRDSMLLFFTGILLLIFYSDLRLVWYEGLILASILVIYITILVRQKQPIEEEVPEGEFKLIDIPKLLFGIVLIVGGAHFLVGSASDIARIFGISEWMIGITIVAAGTSAPELATSVVAIIKGKHGISAGNLIGSDLFNLLGVLGIASMLKPLSITSSEYTSLILLVAAFLVIMIMIRTGWKISKVEGAILIGIALFRWSFDFIF
ncbi:MAG: sodium:calcium antiporter [Ignavibacteriales bacterium]|jgi:cation:H+ antiporter|nr:MAG: sodium:calcium antiporter [Ignavibacteriales bacterium]